jgi:hypothetical protein
MQKLDAELTARGVTRPVIVELDGHSTRYSLDTFKFCFDKGM